MQRLLIATDGEPWSRDAIQHLIDSHRLDAAELHVLAVVPPATLPLDDPHHDEALEARVAAADEALAAATLELAAAGRHVQTLVRVGEPVAAILAAARELDADMLVLGSRGPGPDAASVARAVVREAGCGVLIYPMREQAAAR